MTADEAKGMAWWNGLDDEARAYWMRKAGDTGRAADAWEAFKSTAAQGWNSLDDEDREYWMRRAEGRESGGS